MTKQKIIKVPQTSKRQKLAYFSQEKKIPEFNPYIKEELPSIFSNAPYFTSYYQISIFSNRISWNNPKSTFPAHTPPTRKAKDIKTFSENSRRRLIQLLARVNLKYYSEVYFVSTTFDKVYPENSEELKYFLDRYLKSLKKNYPDLAYIWKLEIQKRGVPHFHFFFFIPNYTNKYKIGIVKKIIKSKWNMMLKDRNQWTKKYSVNFQTVKEKKKVFSYVAKYTSKIDSPLDKLYPGRKYGYSRNLNLEPEQSFLSSEKFLNLFRKKLYMHISQKGKMSDEFKLRFFTVPSFSVLISSEDVLKILSETYIELNPPNQKGGFYD